MGMLLQEFDFEMKYRKMTDNQVADHLFRLEDEAMCELGEETEIDDAFPYKNVLAASHDSIPWQPKVYSLADYRFCFPCIFSRSLL